MAHYQNLQGTTKREMDNYNPEEVIDLEDDDGALNYMNGGVDDFEDDIERDAEMGYTDNDNDQFTTRLQFNLAELGCWQMDKDRGIKLYIPSSQCHTALNDLVGYCKEDMKQNSTVCRYIFGKGDNLKTDFLPLFLGQGDDQILSYNLLIILVYLTQPLESEEYLDIGLDKNDREYKITQNELKRTSFLKRDLQNYKIQLCTPIFWDMVIKHMTDCVKISAEERTPQHDNMLELCVNLVRNVLAIDYSIKYNPIKDSYEASIQAKLYEIFGSSDGVFKALVFLTQDFSSPLSKKLVMVYLEIYALVFKSFPASFLFKKESGDVYLKKLRQKEKAMKIKRINNMGTRHSRFGAKISVRNSKGGHSRIYSNPNFTNKDHYTFDGQKRKPKPQARFNIRLENGNISNQIVSKNIEVLSSEEKRLKANLTIFVLDFLENSFNPLIEQAYNRISKEYTLQNYDDQLNYLVVTAFGLDCYAVGIEDSNKIDCHAGTLDKLDTRGEGGKSQHCDLSHVFSAIGADVIQLVYEIAKSEIGKKKKREINAPLFFSSLNMLYQLLKVTFVLNQSSNVNDVKNSMLLMQNIFTKEFSKIIKIGVDYFEPKIHSGPDVECLFSCMDMFLRLLYQYCGNSVKTLKTDKRVKNKFSKKLNQAKREVGDKNGDEDEEHKEGDTLFGTAEDEYESEEEEEDQYIYKDRLYNYQSELSIFATYDTVSKLMSFIRGDRIVRNPESINNVVYNFLKRIVVDLESEWLFFQNDYLFIFYNVSSNDVVRKMPSFKPMLDLIKRIFASFFKVFRSNELLGVESLFRLPSISTKEEIMNNYEDNVHYTLENELEGGRGLENDDFIVKDQIMEQTAKNWTQTEDTILTTNYPALAGSDDSYQQMSQVLKESGFARSKQEIKKRVNQLNVNQLSGDGVSHTVAFSNKEGAVQLLLYGISTTPENNLKMVDYLKEIIEDYEEYKNVFPSTEVEFALVPSTKTQFRVQSFICCSAIFRLFGLVEPRPGYVYWRVPALVSVSQLKETLSKFTEVYSSLKGLTEVELLDKGDFRRRRKTAAERTRKRQQSNGEKRMSKRQQRVNQQMEEEREQDLINKQFADMDLKGSDVELELELGPDGDSNKASLTKNPSDGGANSGSGRKLKRLSKVVRQFNKEDQKESEIKRKKVQKKSTF